ncbi:MAG: hypothetical protein COZ28_00775, partial [Candidatus Moranbacteria bacterium CG_4_10_14_3_um_filter_44_15]
PENNTAATITKRTTRRLLFISLPPFLFFIFDPQFYIQKPLLSTPVKHFTNYPHFMPQNIVLYNKESLTFPALFDMLKYQTSYST